MRDCRWDTIACEQREWHSSKTVLCQCSSIISTKVKIKNIWSIIIRIWEALSNQRIRICEGLSLCEALLLLLFCEEANHRLLLYLIFRFYYSFHAHYIVTTILIIVTTILYTRVVNFLFISTHWKTLVGGTNSSVGGTSSGTIGIKRKYPLHKSLILISLLIIGTNLINHW